MSIANIGGRPYSPSALFVTGANGVVYEPSDPTTLFTTSTGTTPCAVPGSGSQVLVGLMLDKSQGAPGALGAELVTNGDFSSGSTGWTLGAGWSIVGGAASNDGSGAGQLRQTGLTYVAGKTYKITFAATVAASAVNVVMETTNIGVVSSSGSYTFYFTANANAFNRIYFQPNGGYIGTIDNISVREIPGNHAIAFNDTTARPELSARVNLLTYSEQFENAVWTKTNATVTANSTVAPDGNATADTLVETTASGAHSIAQAFTPAVGTYTTSVYVKASTRTWVFVQNDFGSNNTYQFYNVETGVLGTQSGLGGTATITLVGNGWYRCTLTTTTTTTTAGAVRIYVTTGDGVVSYAGNGTSGIFIWGADLRPANIGSAIPSYQRIADQHTYDSNGFPSYLRFDGVDDSMYTPASIPFATVTSDGLARRNLLSNPTQFDVSSMWAATDVTVTANATIAPDSTTTADLITTTNTPDTLQQLVSVVSGTIYTFSGYVKDSTAGSVFLVSFANTSIPYIQVDLSNGNITYFGGATTATATNVGNGWWRISLTTTANQTASVGFRFASASANAVSAYFLWGAQLETGSTATAFQNIGTDKMSVFAGVRKLSDAAVGMFAELSAAAAINNGSFYVAAPESTGASGNYTFLCGGTAGLTSISSGTLLAPNTSVLTGIGEISTDTKLLRINGAQVASSAGDQGTGNFGTYPLYIGSRANTSLFFNGHLYSLIIAGTQLQSGSITATEQYVAGKTGVQI